MFVGGLLYLVLRMTRPALDAHCKMVNAIAETNRTLQASLLAYHASHPVVSSTTAKMLADRAERFVAAPPPVEETPEPFDITMSSELV